MNKEMSKADLDAALGDGAGIVRAIEAADWPAVAATVEGLDLHELQAHVVALGSLVGSAHGAGAAGSSLDGFLAATVDRARGARP